MGENKNKNICKYYLFTLQLSTGQTNKPFYTITRVEKKEYEHESYGGKLYHIRKEVFVVIIINVVSDVFS